MHAIAALGDAPTAAIAVVAIVLGLLFAVRGPREKRAAAPGPADGGERPGPAMVTLPVAAVPDAEPGFVGPEGEVVGHGPIRLGGHGPLGGTEPAVADSPLPVPAPAPAPVAEAPLAAPEPPLFAASPPAASPEADAPELEPEPPAPPPAEPAEPKEPAWRIAARAANSAVHFRQGTIKVGGKPVDKPKDG